MVVIDNFSNSAPSNIDAIMEVAGRRPVCIEADIVYAYSFPSIIRQAGKFPIKVGLTTGDDAAARVKSQCKQTCCFEHPKVLQVWNVQRVSAVEDAIHATLKARGSKRDAPGTEWFDTTPEEIDAIVKFVQVGTAL